MKIIAFGDIHMATSHLASIDGIAEADLLIVSGDITNFGGRADAKKVLNEILAYNRNLLCLAGNLDNAEVNDYLEDLGMNLHGQAHMIKRQVCVYGVGGSNPTPFQTPWEFTESQLQQTAQEAYRQARELIELAEPMTGHSIPTIFISHAPPHGTAVDRLNNGDHAGSKALRRFIENVQPEFCVTSHIHEARGCDIIGRTQIVNPGMLAGGGWICITLNNNELNYELHP